MINEATEENPFEQSSDNKVSNFMQVESRDG